MSGSTPEDLPFIESESLESIEGLDTVIIQRLRERLNIETVQDLAQASVEEVEEALSDSDLAVSSETALAWITQARQIVETSEAAAWQTPISFLLEFQSRDVDGQTIEQTYIAVQESREEATFSGLGGEDVQDWMIERYYSISSTASDSEDSGEEPPTDLDKRATAIDEQLAPEESFSETNLSLTLNVIRVSIFQPPGARIPMVVSKGIRSLPRPLVAKDAFDLEIFFELPELAQATLPGKVNYRLEGFAKTIDSAGPILSLGESQPSALKDFEPYYETLLPDISLPSGVYRVQLLISFSGAPIPFALHDFLHFHVVKKSSTVHSRGSSNSGNSSA
ncbi:MAG: hypothetical protein VKL39_03000 [Leptolyngbyaceae bacterium]|nr:hypothetical protein [Leptolyngbyaceae bacterium]